MIRLTSLALAACFSILVASASGAPPRPIRPPFRFTISVDRPDYLRREPIFVDWAITNVGDVPVEIVKPIDEVHFTFACRGRDGQAIPIWPASTICARIRFLWLQPGQSVRGWFAFNESFAGIPGAGTFTLQASCKGSYIKRKGEDRVIYGATSNAVSITVAEPKGPDADVVALIDKRMNQRFPSEPAPVRASPEELAIWKYNEGRLESNRAAWYVLHPELCEEVRNQPRSPRFAAVAAFSRGVTTDAVQYLKECEGSLGSSRYLTGLAAYYILSCKQRDSSPDAQKELKTLAERIIATYPNTAIAQNAQEILDELRHPKKYPAFSLDATAANGLSGSLATH